MKRGDGSYANTHGIIWIHVDTNFLNLDKSKTSNPHPRKGIDNLSSTRHDFCKFANGQVCQRPFLGVKGCRCDSLWWQSFFYVKPRFFVPQTSHRWKLHRLSSQIFVARHFANEGPIAPKSWRLKTWASEMATGQVVPCRRIARFYQNQRAAIISCQMLVVLSLPKIPINCFQSNVPGKMKNTTILKPWTSHASYGYDVMHHMVMHHIVVDHMVMQA